MKKDSGQEEKDNSKREAVLTDPVTWDGQVHIKTMIRETGL